MVNEVIIIGRLGADPEGQSFPNGGMIANLSVATTQKWRSKTGELMGHTEWHRVILHGKQADFGMIRFKKGDQIYVCGSLRTRKYQDRQGVTRYITEIHANQLDDLN